MSADWRFMSKDNWIAKLTGAMRSWSRAGSQERFGLDALYRRYAFRRTLFVTLADGAVRVVDVDRLEVTSPLTGQTRRLAGQRLVCMLLSDRQFMAKMVRLPGGVAGSVDQAIRHMTPIWTPFAFEDVYIAGRIPRRTAGAGLSLELRMAPRRDVDLALAEFHKAGLRPDYVALGHHDWTIELNAGKRRRISWRQGFVYALGLIAIAQAIWIVDIRTGHEMGAARAAMRFLSEEAAFARRRKEIEAAISLEAKLRREKLEQRTMTAVLSDLASAFPEGTSLHEIDIRHDQGRITVRASAPFDAVAAIARTKGFKPRDVSSAPIAGGGQDQSYTVTFSIDANGGL